MASQYRSPPLYVGGCGLNLYGAGLGRICRFAPTLRRCRVMVTVVSRWHRTLLLIGSIGPLGHLPASGTVTVAVIGLPAFAGMAGLPKLAYVAVTVVFAGAAVWLHAFGDGVLQTKDSRQLVWDELAGFLIAVAFLPFTWKLALLALLIERGFDIAKVPPARWIEEHWPGGWGVVGDDVVAGLYTCGLLHLALRFWPSLGQ